MSRFATAQTVGQKNSQPSSDAKSADATGQDDWAICTDADRRFGGAGKALVSPVAIASGRSSFAPPSPQVALLNAAADLEPVVDDGSAET
ncbi:MAG: hypothetical protein AAF907_01490, partial [Planctomycetota bacterium]